MPSGPLGETEFPFSPPEKSAMTLTSFDRQTLDSCTVYLRFLAYLAPDAEHITFSTVPYAVNGGARPLSRRRTPDSPPNFWPPKKIRRVEIAAKCGQPKIRRKNIT